MRHILVLTIFVITLFTVSTETTAAATATTTPTHDAAAVEKSVRSYFANTPVMIEIARCESKFRQFTDSGAPLRSAGMIGVFQFFESIHAPIAKTRGFDLATLDGNLGYAKYLYDTEGTTPWEGSRYCWQTVTPAKTTISSADRAKMLEQIALLTKLIALLQQQLALQQLAKA